MRIDPVTVHVHALGTILEGVADLHAELKTVQRGGGPPETIWSWNGRLVVGQRTAPMLIDAGIFEIRMPDGRTGQCFATEHRAGDTWVTIKGTGHPPWG